MKMLATITATTILVAGGAFAQTSPQQQPSQQQTRIQKKQRIHTPPPNQSRPGLTGKQQSGSGVCDQTGPKGNRGGMKVGGGGRSRR